MNTWTLTVVGLVWMVGLNSAPIRAQTSLIAVKQVGIEVQGYPAGIMPGVCMDIGKWEHATISTRVGFDIVCRQGYSGLNDDERGWGPGVALGYRYHSGNSFSGFYAVVRADMWWLTIAWQDRSNRPNQGSTDVLVLIPTLEIGYLLPIKQTPYKIGFGIAQGREINLISLGKDVGQGYITLITCKAVKAF